MAFVCARLLLGFAFSFAAAVVLSLLHLSFFFSALSKSLAWLSKHRLRGVVLNRSPLYVDRVSQPLAWLRLPALVAWLVDHTNDGMLGIFHRFV